MLVYLLFGLLFVLTGIAGLQFTYLFYFDRLDRERKKHLHDLERRAERLAVQLKAAETLLAERDALIEKFVPATANENEMWADVIDEL